MCVCVRVCVCGDQVDLRLHIASTHRFHSADEEDFFWRNYQLQITLVCNIFLSGVLDLHRGGAGSRSAVVLLGELTGFPSNPASLFTDTSRVILETRQRLYNE